MVDDAQQLYNSLEAVRRRIKNLSNKLGAIQETIDSRTMIKSRNITDTIKELCEFSKLQETCFEEYKSLFNEELGIDHTFDSVSEKLKEYNDEKLKAETGDIVYKFSNISSLDNECQEKINAYLQKLSSIGSAEMNLDEYKSAVSDYIRFYNAVESEDVYEKINFSKEDNIFSKDPFIVLSLIQGKIYIKT